MGLGFMHQYRFGDFNVGFVDELPDNAGISQMTVAFELATNSLKGSGKCVCVDNLESLHSKQVQKDRAACQCLEF